MSIFCGLIALNAEKGPVETVIAKIRKLIQDYVFAGELSLDARMINMIFLLGFAGASAILVSRLIMGTNAALIAIILTILLSIAFLMYICNRYQVYRLGSWAAVITISEILFPLAFFFLGGLNSSIAAYFILSIVVIVFLMRGKALGIMLFIHMTLIVVCYALGALFPNLVMANLTPLQRLEDGIFSVLILGSVVGAIIKFQKTIFEEERNKTLETSQTLASALEEVGAQDKLLQAGNNVAEILLLSEAENINETLRRAMEELGGSLDIDRLYIWRTRFIDGNRVYVQEHEWNSEEFQATRTLKEVYGRSYMNMIPRWETLFSVSQYVNGPVSSFPAVEQELLSTLDLKSLLVIPAFLKDLLWGFVTFDNCHSERTYTEDEVSILKSSTLMFANTIERYQDEQIISSRLKQQQLMSVISQSFISTRPMEELVQEALGQISEFLQATRALIAVADKDSEESYPVYQWAISEEWTPKPARTGFNDIINNAFPRKMPVTGYVEPVYCNNTHDSHGGKYRPFEAADLKSFIWAPIYVEGDYWGMLSIEDCLEYRNWNESDRQLVGSVVSAIAGGVGRDLIEKERETALDEAVKASKAKGDFLSNMSHEMRTPMNAIIGMTSIGRSADTIDRKDYAFEKIDDASTHLLGVINDILDMSKIEADKLELYHVDFDFEEMLHKVFDVISFRVEERSQNFEYTLDKRIPRMLYGDNQRLAQVVTNLLSNAVKFTPESGTIRLDAHFLGEEAGVITLKLDVTDTGIGITEEQKERLFSPFEQAESGTQRKFGGTGLGLVISKRIVEMMGGNIWIDSEPDKGSVFQFTFKVGHAHSNNASATSQEQESTAEKIDDFGAYHVLLAEDMAINQEIVLALLEPTGLKITCADNGVIALAMFRDAPDAFDAIFMDVQMPEMDGYETAERIRALDIPQAKEIPIIAMTANVFKEDIEKALASGMNDHIGKPLDLETVLAKLRQYLT
jgi:signal transduction histidine kinase